MANENVDYDHWLGTPAGQYGSAWKWGIELLGSCFDGEKFAKKYRSEYSSRSWIDYVEAVQGVFWRAVVLWFIWHILRRVPNSRAAIFFSKAPVFTLFFIVILVISSFAVFYYTFIFGEGGAKKPGRGDRIFGGFYKIHCDRYREKNLMDLLAKLYYERISFLATHPPCYVPQVKYSDMNKNISYWYDKKTNAHYAEGEGPAVAFGSLVDGEKFWYDEVSEKFYRGEDPRKHPAIDKYFFEDDGFVAEAHKKVAEGLYSDQFEKYRSLCDEQKNEIEHFLQECPGASFLPKPIYPDDISPIKFIKKMDVDETSWIKLGRIQKDIAEKLRTFGRQCSKKGLFSD